MCWLCPIQSLSVRQRQYLELTLPSAIHEALKSWDGIHEKSSNVHWEQKTAVTSGPWLAGCQLAGMRSLLNFEDMVFQTDLRAATKPQSFGTVHLMP